MTKFYRPPEPIYIKDLGRMTPTRGACCACGYGASDETPCPAREDGTHCNHWWDGPDAPGEKREGA